MKGGLYFEFLVNGLKSKKCGVWWEFRVGNIIFRNNEVKTTWNYWNYSSIYWFQEIFLGIQDPSFLLVWDGRLNQNISWQTISTKMKEKITILYCFNKIVAIYYNQAVSWHLFTICNIFWSHRNFYYRQESNCSQRIQIQIVRLTNIFFPFTILVHLSVKYKTW